MKLSPNVAWVEIDGEAIIVDNKLFKMYQLNESAVKIWNKVLDGLEKEEVIRVLTGEYGIQYEDDIRNDVEEFYKELENNNILIYSQ